MFQVLKTSWKYDFFWTFSTIFSPPDVLRHLCQDVLRHPKDFSKNDFFLKKRHFPDVTERYYFFFWISITLTETTHYMDIRGLDVLSMSWGDDEGTKVRDNYPKVVHDLPMIGKPPWPIMGHLRFRVCGVGWMTTSPRHYTFCTLSRMGVVSRLVRSGFISSGWLFHFSSPPWD